MIDKDRAAFAEVLAAVYTFYRQDFSDAAFGIWWSSMRLFDLAAIRDALGRHAMNPDTGQFLPKPADVVRMLGGSTLDSALVAWTKVDEAVRAVGGQSSVAFDDALIHRVVDEMGGWILLCGTTLKEWPFKQNEFVNRYRGYKVRSETPPYPPKLIGVFDAENGDRWLGHPGAKPDENLRLIGDAEVARKVMLGGSDVPRLGITAGALAAKVVAAIEVKR